MHTVLIIAATAICSSVLTVVLGSWLLRRFWERELEMRLRQLHDDIGRTVETRVRRAVAESVNEPRPADMLRDSTWRAARSGSDLLTDSLGSLIGRWRRQTDDV